jgi:hypothetical protein
MSIPTIDQWEVVGTVDSYLPPESQSVEIRGYIYGHSDWSDGELIHTSPIVSVEGNLVKTTHNTYRLLKANSRYYNYCLANNLHLPTDEEPIKLKLGS